MRAARSTAPSRAPRVSSEAQPAAGEEADEQHGQQAQPLGDAHELEAGDPGVEQPVRSRSEAMSPRRHVGPEREEHEQPAPARPRPGPRPTAAARPRPASRGGASPTRRAQRGPGPGTGIRRSAVRAAAGGRPCRSRHRRGWWARSRSSAPGRCRVPGRARSPARARSGGTGRATGAKRSAAAREAAASSGRRRADLARPRGQRAQHDERDTSAP